MTLSKTKSDIREPIAVKGAEATSVALMKEATFDTGENKLNYAEGPDAGPPLVLLHGGSARGQCIGMLLDDFDNFAAGYDLEAFGSSIKCPVLPLQADARLGSATTDDELRGGLACLSRARHKLFPGLSHLLFVEDKAVVLRASEEFLAEVEAGAVQTPGPVVRLN